METEATVQAFAGIGAVSSLWTAFKIFQLGTRLLAQRRADRNLVKLQGDAEVQDLRTTVQELQERLGQLALPHPDRYPATNYGPPEGQGGAA